MACMTAVSLRNAARETLLAAGGRGFVRFAESGALLVSDAIRRCESDAAKEHLLEALAQAGFVCMERGGLLMMNPSDVLLETIAFEGCFSVNWADPLCGLQALARRWLSRKKRPLTPDGRQLVIDALRLTWQDRRTDGFEQLRAQAAVMQRNGDTSGFDLAGAVLAHWCIGQEKGGNHHED